MHWEDVTTETEAPPAVLTIIMSTHLLHLQQSSCYSCPRIFCITMGSNATLHGNVYYRYVERDDDDYVDDDDIDD